MSISPSSTLKSPSASLASASSLTANLSWRQEEKWCPKHGRASRHSNSGVRAYAFPSCPLDQQGRQLFNFFQASEGIHWEQGLGFFFVAAFVCLFFIFWYVYLAWSVNKHLLISIISGLDIKELYNKYMYAHKHTTWKCIYCLFQHYMIWLYCWNKSGGAMSPTHWPLG